MKMPHSFPIFINACDSQARGTRCSPPLEVGAIGQLDPSLLSIGCSSDDHGSTSTQLSVILANSSGVCSRSSEPALVLSYLSQQLHFPGSLSIDCSNISFHVQTANMQPGSYNATILMNGTLWGPVLDNVSQTRACVTTIDGPQLSLHLFR